MRTRRALLPLPPFDGKDDQRAHDECAGDGNRREQARLDCAGEGEPQHCGGQERDQEVQREALRAAIARQPASDGEKSGPVFPADGDDGAGLDDNLEQFRPLAGEIQQRSGDDQVTGRRHRQKFGQALDQAEDRCNGEVQCCHCLGWSQKKAGGSRRPAVHFKPVLPRQIALVRLSAAQRARPLPARARRRDCRAPVRPASAG